MIIRKPNTKERKKVLIISQSILDNLLFSSDAMTIKRSKGPQAIHSPHSEAGEATLKTNKWVCSSLNYESAFMIKIIYPRISMHIPPQSNSIARNVAIVAIDTLLRVK